ncbi:MAG: hypothetical protein BYD32DRAFT_252584 [Podila humilis]|nr:MAG: hypothetical protein BYD32DRAFT_252584 [Podila humilis]
MLHANTLQYAWMWSWFNNHSGSSGQNVVACDSKVYTASKWILLPAKDTVRTRKDWKVSYGDRVWLTSYWFSTRNAKMELPEYLPLARGAPCRHIIPYGETYIICKTCPADVLCMRCFRASDHTDHTMYLQCSWGTSVCLCNDKRHSPNHPHCSIHSAEMEPSYSHLAKGKLCTAKLKSDETIYICKLHRRWDHVMRSVLQKSNPPRTRRGFYGSKRWCCLRLWRQQHGALCLSQSRALRTQIPTSNTGKPFST